jgi:hypothetical protein
MKGGFFRIVGLKNNIFIDIMVAMDALSISLFAGFVISFFYI